MQFDHAHPRITGSIPALRDADEVRGEVALVVGRHVHAAHWHLADGRVHVASPHGQASGLVGRGHPPTVARGLLRDILERAAARGALQD